MAYLAYSLVDPLDSLHRSLSQLERAMSLAAPLAACTRPEPKVAYYRPWRHVSGQHSGMSNVSLDKEGFQIKLDVQQFAPEEISVKTVDDHIVVEGKHEEKEDEHGFVYRHFVRRYAIPEGVKADAMTSSLSSDGVLTICAPKLEAIKGGNERVINIVQTGMPARKAVEGSEKQPVEGK
ncbi:heat shock protein 23-like [Ischnura elegans]|uniref:heat shock protein 23-like n=1 Tax=Ischnura elegans TaxID=197161 RepID=UPI001ED8AC10|nr:heat shock protein 23-like [Ischnura elegans]